MVCMDKIKVKRICTLCFFHYYKDLEDDECFEVGGCNSFSPIGLRLEDVEIIIK